MILGIGRSRLLEYDSPSLNELFSLDGKLALITGGAGYLGTAMSEALIEAGAHLAIASRDQKKCQRLAEKLNEEEGKERALGFQLDIREKSTINHCLDQIENMFGDSIDILINNAAQATTGKLEEIKREEWLSGVESTLNGVFNVTKQTLPYLKEGDSEAVIVNIASMYGMVAPDFSIYGNTDFDNPPSYGASKAGVIQFTRYAASELAKYNIRVNSISPGPFPNEEVQKHEDFIKRLESKNMLHRIGSPHELKGAIVFLASPASSYVTGHNLVVDGGWTAW